jgi:hypothetical protein
MNMSFATKISAIYRAHGPKHLLPFIGQSYENGSPEAFRVAVIGLNAYISDGDWPEDDAELQGWYCGWWSKAGHGKSHRFFNTAYREAGLLADELAQSSKIFTGLTYDTEPQSKSGFYGTNAVKIFLGEQHKTSDGLADADFRQYAPAWQQELDTMAERRVLPHLIVVLGRQIWDLMWGSFYPEGSNRVQYQHFTVTDYQTCGSDGGSCYHFANRITVKVGSTRQKLLLVRLAHPANYGDQRRAEWLLGEKDFRKLAGLP